MKTLPERITQIETQHSKAVVVSRRLSLPHVLVLRAKAYLDKQSPSNWRGFENALETRGDHIPISVTKGNVSRALRIMDTMIKLLEKRGHEVSLAHQSTRIRIKGEDIHIKCRDKCNRKKIKTDRWERSELVPNGKLSIKIVESYRSKEWIDGNDPLENKIAQVVAELEFRADEAIARKARWEIQRQEQTRLEAIRDRELAMAVWEKEKINLLLKHSEDWHRVQRLRSFLEYIDERVGIPEGSGRDEEWMRWAREQVDLLNPLSEGVEDLVGTYEFKEEASTSR